MKTFIPKILEFWLFVGGEKWDLDKFWWTKRTKVSRVIVWEWENKRFIILK